MMNSSDTIGNQTRDLLSCSAVPQSTAPLCTPKHHVVHHNLKMKYQYSLLKFKCEIFSVVYHNLEVKFFCSSSQFGSEIFL